MAWTAPRTWVTGEVVTASMMNVHVRDNLKALNDLSAVSLLQPAYNLGTYSTSLGAVLGSNADLRLTGLMWAVNFGNMLTVSASIQWRMSSVFNVSVAAAGASTLDWTAKVYHSAERGVTSASGVVSIGSAVSVANVTGYGAYDSGFVSAAAVASGLRVFNPLWRSDRTGGSVGQVTDTNLMLEVKNV